MTTQSGRFVEVVTAPRAAARLNAPADGMVRAAPTGGPGSVPPGGSTSSPASQTIPIKRGQLIVALSVAAFGIQLLPEPHTVLLVLSGSWLLLVGPAFVWRPVVSRIVPARSSALLVAVGLAIVSALVLGLLANTVLPQVGVLSPLRRLPLASIFAASVIICALPDAIRGPRLRRLRLSSVHPPVGLAVVLGTGTVMAVSSVAGAIRLNNGFGSAVSMAALGMNAVLLCILYLRTRAYKDQVIALGIYLSAACLLLQTSLRGWYITGHDIQLEYMVYELANATGRWEISDFQNAYNACLSVSILPTAMSQLSGISGLALFKVVYPLLFALVPVVVYVASRTYASKRIALLAVIYVIAFPTFFSDMPFLVRQQVAFLLFAIAIAVACLARRSSRTRFLILGTLLVGVVLSHYSTTYVLILIFVLARLVRGISNLPVPALRRFVGRRLVGARSRTAFTWPLVAVAALSAVLWTSGVTGTSGQLAYTMKTMTAGIFGIGPGAVSSDAGYAVLFGQKVQPEERMRSYAEESIAITHEDREAGNFPPLEVVSRYPTPVVHLGALPQTALGSTLMSIGIDVPRLNAMARQLFSMLLQVLLVLGLLRILLGARTSGFRASADIFGLTVGVMFFLALQTILPGLSADYGILRGFQQGLLIFAPIIVVGTLTLFSWRVEHPRSKRLLACAPAVLAIAFFLDLTGAIPAALGGYPAQLNLSNSGKYYNLYYVHPEERTAVEWLSERVDDREGRDVQSEVLTYAYSFTSLPAMSPDHRLDNDVYPLYIRSDSTVFLGSAAVRRREATFFYEGDLVTYRYPLDFLDATKNKIYSSRGAAIYEAGRP